jgi:hypothetical protein
METIEELDLGTITFLSEEEDPSEPCNWSSACRNEALWVATVDCGDSNQMCQRCRQAAEEKWIRQQAAAVVICRICGARPLYRLTWSPIGRK